MTTRIPSAATAEGVPALDQAIAAAPAASAPPITDRRRIIGAIDELTSARVEALLTLELLELQLKDDPRQPGLTYGLTDEQVEMMQHSANLTLGSIRRALNVLEAAR